MVTQRASKRDFANSDEERSRRLFERFLPTAKAIPAEKIILCRADVALAHRNVAMGVGSVLALEDVVRRELPFVDIAHIRSLPELSIGVVYAATQVDRFLPSKELTSLLSRARDLRSLLLMAAEALAQAKLFDAHVVAKIRAGRGDIDAAKDCIELAALFTKHADALRGKTHISRAQVKEAAAVGADLIALLKPSKLKLPKQVQQEVAEARDHRDRLWTLLDERHDTLRRVGAYLFGLRSLDSKVPTLQMRVFVKRAPKRATKAAAPASAGDERPTAEES